ncbi:MAG: hypothetical protein JO264_17765 [Acidisphaera sp.]|nr:hypothetical protein [Acidisphaera sp.]
MPTRLFAIRRLLPALLLAWPVLDAAPVAAQVTVNPHALDQLGGPPVEQPAPEPQEAPAHGRRPPPRHPVAHAPAHPPARPVAHAAPPPVVPQAAPAVPVLLPAVPQAPPHPTTPPPLPTVTADAPGDVAKITSGIRVTFGAERADLNPTTEGALRVLAHTATENPSVVFNVLAYAPGKPDDASTPRRLSLSRALAARSVLIHEGIPSTRIYVRALGANGIGDAPPDRVDVSIASNDAPANPAAAPAASPLAGAQAAQTPPR